VLKIKSFIVVSFIAISFFTNCIAGQSILEKVKHGYVENNGVKIHYATIGSGPLIVMLHGFPDFWYTWKEQMETLSDNYKVVAIDLRGYNKSDKPEGVENYKMKFLIGDVAAVIKHFTDEKAVVVGHDWGGAIAWQVAMWRPELVGKLIILSTPHPNGLFREIKNNPEQQKHSEYAIDFQKPDAYKQLTAEGLASWVKDEEDKKIYIDAFERSDFEAMLNYYKASFPKKSSDSTKTVSKQPKQQRKVMCPTLAIFGLEDRALLPSGWNGTWNWVDNNLTLVSIPKAGHFVHHDAKEIVTRTIKMWLTR
jgi:pimeloyl-ACP methyl ester carboxylesterase